MGKKGNNKGKYKSIVTHNPKARESDERRTERKHIIINNLNIVNYLVNSRRNAPIIN